jgi:hypothetical protein
VDGHHGEDGKGREKELFFTFLFLNAATPGLILQSLTNIVAAEAALQRHPHVRCSSGLVCTGTDECSPAWCSGALCSMQGFRRERRRPASCLQHAQEMQLARARAFVCA